MTRIHSLVAAFTLAATPVLAQQADDHSQHHPNGASQTTGPQSGGAAVPAPSPAPAAPSAAAAASSPGAGGMMQMMMRNMPEQCRAAMQNMPPACMPMMEKMMSGMMQGGMMQGGMARAQGQGGGGAASSSPSGAHSDHGASGAAGGGGSMAPHVAAFNDAVEKMHEPMAAGVRDDDPDAAFARGMIPHHQAAIDMALVVLKFGKDERMRKLALDVIREQNREIAEMNEWLRQKVK